MQHDFILLDRSGSMSANWTEALSAINAYVAKLAEDRVDTGVTLAAFDFNIGALSFDILRDRITPSTWRMVTDEDAQPRGYTPLNDATGKIVALANAGGYDKVAIIIMTDGEENASKELTVTQAKLLLDQCRAKGWQVIFLGANFDNARQSAHYGNAVANTVAMASGTMRSTTVDMASKRATYGVTGQSIIWSDAEKEALAKAKPTA